MYHPTQKNSPEGKAANVAMERAVEAQGKWENLRKKAKPKNQTTKKRKAELDKLYALIQEAKETYLAAVREWKERDKDAYSSLMGVKKRKCGE
jgi:hypothetical protein